MRVKLLLTSSNMGHWQVSKRQRTSCANKSDHFIKIHRTVNSKQWNHWCTFFCSMQSASMLPTCRHTSEVCHVHTSVAEPLTMVFSLLAMAQLVLPPSAWRTSLTGSSRTRGVRTGGRTDTTRYAGVPMFATSAASTPWSLPCLQSTPRRSRLWSVVFPDDNGDFIYCRTTMPASNICSICVLFYISKAAKMWSGNWMLAVSLCLACYACYTLFGCSQVITSCIRFLIYRSFE